MEDNQTSSQVQAPQVSFPQPREPEAHRNGSPIKMIVAVLGVIIIVALGGWFILGNESGGGATSTPTPVVSLSTFPTPAPVETPQVSATPSPAPVDKSEIKIEILNGTGVPGEAGFLQTELKKLGFEKLTAGNAGSQNSTETVATYSRDLSQTVADEITAKLEELYATVKTRKGTVSGDYDLSITTGPRKGAKATAKATATASAKASATPTATGTSTASPTPTPTPTQ